MGVGLRYYQQRSSVGSLNTNDAIWRYACCNVHYILYISVYIYTLYMRWSDIIFDCRYVAKKTMAQFPGSGASVEALQAEPWMQRFFGQSHSSSAVRNAKTPASKMCDKLWQHSLQRSWKYLVLFDAHTLSFSQESRIVMPRLQIFNLETNTVGVAWPMSAWILLQISQRLLWLDIQWLTSVTGAWKGEKGCCDPRFGTCSCHVLLDSVTRVDW